MKLLTDDVSVGDHFIKVGDYSRTVYVVHSLVDACSRISRLSMRVSPRVRDRHRRHA
jgi:hypothetical protein